jgi:hypothetical protein
LIELPPPGHRRPGRQVQTIEGLNSGSAFAAHADTVKNTILLPAIKSI